MHNSVQMIISASFYSKSMNLSSKMPGIIFIVNAEKRTKNQQIPLIFIRIKVAQKIGITVIWRKQLAEKFPILFLSSLLKVMAICDI